MDWTVIVCLAFTGIVFLHIFVYQLDQRFLEIESKLEQLSADASDK